MNVVNLAHFRKQEHVNGNAKCLSCDHEWHATAKVGTTWLECEKCGTMKGRFKNPIVRGKTLYHCECGNELFQISENGIYCPMCGTEHNPFE
jgi:Zn finger protein HypA/HybF involved in hydrogenase expression